MKIDKVIKTLNVYNEFKSNFLAGKLSQAYIFFSPDLLTNQTLLLNLAKILLCETNSSCEKCSSCIKLNAGTHPDLLIYPKDKNFIVDDANDIYDNIQIKPIYSKYKVYIINNIDVSTEQAQNKMLKILEEPPQNVIFLMSACNAENVLPTIKSRAQSFDIDKLNLEDFKYIFDDVSDDILRVAINFSDGYFGKAVQILDGNFIDCYKNMLKLLTNLIKSEQIPFYSTYFIKDKQTFCNNLTILNSIYRDLLMFMLNKQNLIKNINLIELYKTISKDYKIVSINTILQLIDSYGEVLSSSVSLQLLADNLLFDILEVKFKCK